MKRFILPVLRPFFLLLGLAVSTAAGAAPAWRVFQHENVLGTSLELKFVSASAADAERAETAALAEIDRLGRILSGYDAGSEFSRWAATQGEARRVSPELFAVLALFDTWRERTGGALDASAEVAGRLWRDAAVRQRVPSAEEIEAAVAAVRATHWRLDATTQTAVHLTTAPLRLNSFAKGFIIDRACAAALAAAPVTTAIVNLGGDLLVRGADAETIGIIDPLADAENDAPAAWIATRDRAVATSGGYRRGVEIGGRWYSHLVDPRTGRPVDHVRSATVVADTAAEAGALATALCVLTPEEGLQLVARNAGASCLLILGDGRRLASAGWSGLEVAPPAGTARWAGVVAAKPDDTGAAAAPAGGDFELTVNLELASVGGGRAKRPFVAVWIEDADNFPVRTLALWFHGARWLPDLRAWSRADHLRAMAEGTQIANSISSATRSPGRYTLRWDGRDAAGHALPAGRYTLFIEAAREHGTHQLMKQELSWDGAAARYELPGNVEVAAASVEAHRKGAAR